MAEQTFRPGEANLRTRTSIVRIVRMAFLVLLATVTLLYAVERTTNIGTQETTLEAIYGWWIPVAAAVVCGSLVLSLDLITPRKKISTISGIAFGVIIGLTATAAVASVIDLFVVSYEIRGAGVDKGIQGVKVLVGLCLCYLCTSVILQTQDDFRLVIPYVEFAKQIRGTKPLLLDTSALIDARIADLAATGMLQSPLVIPGFVIAELQTLADSEEKLKRTRGRRGLEVVTRLQRSPGLDITIDETNVPGKAVDQMLVELARTMPGIVVTADAGLSRVASIQGVRVLNINDVANALKPALVPGRTLDLPLLRAGEQPGQAVGFLDDGTMIVVEKAADRIGRTAPVEVTSSLQTSAGRLIFARLADAPPSAPEGAAPQEPLPAPGETEADPTPDPAANTSDAAPADGPPPIGAPLRIAPPEQNDLEKPGPFPPRRGQRGNPMRNPRR